MTAKPRTYWYTLLALTAIYGWLWLQFSNRGHHRPLPVCIIKNITGYPCPSCGTTRGVMALLHGQWATALWLNPLSIVAIITLITTTLLFTLDTFLPGRDRLGQTWNQLETQLRKPAVLIIFGLLITSNWIWNILKAL